MARIFSWHIKDESKECFSYLATGASGSYSTGYMVLGDKISSDTDLKKIAEVVSGYTEGTYEAQFNGMKQAVADCGFTVTWKNYKEYYDVDGSNLVMLTGIGERGQQGAQGEQGPKGETGAAGKGRNIMCYCGLDSGITPTRANVSGGKFYPNRWDIEYPTDPHHICTWQDSNEFGLDKVVWMTNADFPSSTGDSPSEYVTPIPKSDGHGGTYTWSTPIRISGPKGDNGADGESIEFVYKRAHKRTDPVPTKPTGTTEAEAIQQGWTDHPLGIVGDKDNPEQNWRVEYMSQHIRDEVTGEWGEFTDPVLWASWGEDGIDGDGIEYIFAITQEYTAPGNVPNKDMRLALENGGELVLADIWQEPEVYDYFSYCGVTKTNDGITVDPDGKYFYGKTGRTDTRHASIFPWTDDPMDVSSGEPYEWVCIRRSKWDKDEEHSVYGDFSEPILWAHWGRDGQKGNDGTSVDIRDQADSLGKLLKKLGSGVPQVGFSYAIGVDGKRVYVWMEQDSSYHEGRTQYTPPMSPTTWYDKPDSEIYSGYYYRENDKNYWFTDCGSFYGEPGENAYVHMKYATDYTGQTGVDHRTVTISGVEGTRDICFTSNTGETPGPYIAVYTDNIEDDRGDLAYYDNFWAKFEGDDGQSYGQEQIFFRTYSKINIGVYTKVATENAHGYEIGEKYLRVTYPDSCFTTPDWVPMNWTDVPMGIQPGTYNFEYVAVRRLVQDGTEYDGTWSYFSLPALYNEAVDTPTFQVEYTKWLGTQKPQLTSANDFTVNGVFDEVAWRANEAAKTPSIEWSDENDVDTTWMAQCNGHYENSDETKLIWDDWIVIRCKGIDGKAGNGRNIMAYCSLPEGYTPTKENVTGGRFYPNRWDISYPNDNVGIKPEGLPKRYCSWGDSNEPEDPSYMVWMTNADFPNSTGSSPDESVTPIVKTDSTGGTYTWAEPVCITGEKGDNGADGESVEFIYFLTSGDTKPDRPGGESDPDYQKPDYLPWAYINGQATYKRWTDHPTGISESMPFEWMSMRTRDGVTGLWGSFSEVSAWSRWGEDGIDGDGVEYIFATAMTPNEADALWQKVPKETDARLRDHWQDPEIWDFIRISGYTDFYRPWTDDPSDVSPTEPYEYVSIRRKQYNESVGDAIYYEFEKPTLWAVWADDGDEIIAAFAFTVRQEGDDISGYTVSGADTGKTNPDLVPVTTKNNQGTDVSSSFTWTDTPEPENFPAASGVPIVWMVKATFRKHINKKTSQVTWTQESNWSSPTRMVDTDNFETMYSPGKPISGGYDPNDVETLPNGFKKLGEAIDAAWYTRAKAKGWYDDITDPAWPKDGSNKSLPASWMATISGSNNKFNDNDWNYMRVRGEKGDSGATGVSKFKSIIFQRSNTTPARPTGGNYLSPLPDPIGNWQDTVPQGSAKLWMSSRTFSSDGADAQYWDVPSQCTDTEYIDYEWTNHWKTMTDAESHRPLKSSPNQSITPAQNNQWYDEPISGATFMAVKEVSNGAYVNTAQTAWTVSQIKGEKGDDGEYPHDLDYLMDVFGKKNVDQGNGAVLREFLGVTDDGSASSNVVAFMNGSSGTNNTFVDSTDGKLMIAAGIEGGLAYAKSAKFRVFSNGKIYAEAADISGTINADSGSFKGTIVANSGTIGGIEISNNGLSSQNFSVDSDGNLIVSSIKISTENFSLGDNIYNSVSEFTGATGTSVSARTTNIDVWSGETALSTDQQQYLVAPTSLTKTLLSYNVDAKQSVTVTIDYEYEYAVEFQSTSQLHDYGYIKPLADISINLGIYDGNDYVSSLNAYTGLTLSDITRTPGGSSSAITGSTTFKITQGIGNHTLKIGIDENFSAVGYYDSNAGSNFTWRISKLAFKINTIKVNGIITNEGTEIFQNGFGLKSNANNYFFVNRTTGSSKTLNLNIKSNGSGITLDSNGLSIDMEVITPKKVRIITSGNVTVTTSDSYIVTLDKSTLTMPSASSVPLGKEYHIKHDNGDSGKGIQIYFKDNAYMAKSKSSGTYHGIVNANTSVGDWDEYTYKIIRADFKYSTNGSTYDCKWLIYQMD